jgi:hypothetical protein
LLRVAGVASSLIASEAPKNDKIVVWGAGPRVRISCIYDEDALADHNQNEQKLPKSPTDGDWSMSLPCQADDLAWVKAALAKQSARVTARKLGEALNIGADDDKGDSAVMIDKEAFLCP